MIDRLEDKFDARFDKLDDRLIKLDHKVEIVSRITDKNTMVLEEHQRRALANEKHADLLEQKLDIQRNELVASFARHEASSVERSVEIEQKQKELAESVELFVKMPTFMYKIAKWLAAITAGGAALWALFRFAFRYMA
jgi:hypothetical protein